MKTNDRFGQYRDLNAIMSKASHEMGQTPLALECLGYIGGQTENSLTVRDVFQGFSHVPASSVSRTTADLMREGIVTKEYNLKDGRNPLISLTSEGRKKYKNLMSYFENTD